MTRSPFSTSNPLTPKEHVDGATENFRFAEWLHDSSGADSPSKERWAITLLFYSAVHYVRAYLLAEKGIVINEHKALWDLIKYDYPLINRPKGAYNFLYVASRAGRYYFKTFTKADYDDCRMKAANIRSNIESLMKKSKKS